MNKVEFKVGDPVTHMGYGEGVVVEHPQEINQFKLAEAEERYENACRNIIKPQP